MRVLVAGDGPTRAACAALAVRLGVASHVDFLGPVPNRQMPDLLSIASVFVSTSERSSRGVATCEAMVCGVPVVAFDVGDTGPVVWRSRSSRS
jgi:phenylacetate-CoA ligase